MTAEPCTPSQVRVPVPVPVPLDVIVKPSGLLQEVFFGSGLDYVSHEDILPYNSAEQLPIQHELFERFLLYNPAKCKRFCPPVATSPLMTNAGLTWT